jgi:hypothetical protein
LYCEGLTSLRLGTSLSAIGESAFAGCSALTSISALTTTPPTLGVDVFDDVTLSAITLAVPTSAVATYNAADVWKEMNVVGGASAIADVQANTRLQIFPNPATDFVTITSPSLPEKGDVNTVIITDLQGRTVGNYELQITNYGATINVSALPAGVYFVKVGDSVGKFIIN